MKLVVFLGSPIRAHIIEYLQRHEIPVAAVFVPSGEEHSGVYESVNKGSIPTTVAGSRLVVEDQLQHLAPDVILAVGWPFLFKSDLINGPWILLNSHPTLLPKYRGFNPWANIIENGEKEAGVTIYKIDERFDTGPILYQEQIPLTPFDTYCSLRSKLLELEPQVALKAIKKIQDGNVAFAPQDHAVATSYPKRRTPEDSEIDPRRSLLELYNNIRACDPERFPAFFYVEGQKVCIKLWRPQKKQTDHPETL